MGNNSCALRKPPIRNETWYGALIYNNLQISQRIMESGEPTPKIPEKKYSCKLVRSYRGGIMAMELRRVAECRRCQRTRWSRFRSREAGTLKPQYAVID